MFKEVRVTHFDYCDFSMSVHEKKTLSAELLELD